MKKKPILLSGLFVLLSSLPVQAQETPSPEREGVHAGSLERPRFVDNWYIEAGGGAQLLFSDDASRLKFKDRLSPSVSLTLGKWFSPYWGLRLQGGGWEVYGYNGIKGNYIGDPLPGLGGAYGPDDPSRDHVTIRPDGSYEQTVRYANVHADFQFSLANLIGGFKPERRWDVIPAAGLGYTRVIPYKGIPKANVLSAHFSLMAKYRLCERLDLNLEASTSVLPDRFDGRISGGKPYAETLGLTLGLTWRLGKRKFQPLHCVYYDQLQQSQEALRDSQRREAEWKKAAESQPKEIIREVETPAPAPEPFNLCSIQFRSDHYTVNAREHEPALSNIAAYLEHHDGSTVVLKGYADKETGYAEYNEKMARQRAESVASYLVDHYGVDRDRIRVESYGDTAQPYVTNHWNRAVLVEIVYP